MPHRDHEWLLRQARERPPINPKNTVSSFSDWVFRLYHGLPFQGEPGSRDAFSDSQRIGKIGEFEIERRHRLQRQPDPVSNDTELRHADPLDGSGRPFQISDLLLGDNRLWGIPDVVYRKKATNCIIIFERKVSSKLPKPWPNLKVQLWCYGLIDQWKSAPEVWLFGSIYDPDPKYEFRGDYIVYTPRQIPYIRIKTVGRFGDVDSQQAILSR